MGSITYDSYDFTYFHWEMITFALAEKIKGNTTLSFKGITNTDLYMYVVL